MSHGSAFSGIVLRRADGTAMSKKEVIVIRRGYFKSWPVLCSNDLVHGSWWMVWGSLLTAAFALVPLIQEYESFYKQHDDLLPSVDFKITWSLLVISGIAFTLGSLAFVRAFEEPPKQPLLHQYRHFQTDELLGAWLFLLGTVPGVPYTLVYFSLYPTFTYFGSFVGSLVFLVGTGLFVYTCYPSPSGKKHKNHVLPTFIQMFGPRIWVIKHLANDWLAGTWFFFWANFIFSLGSIFLLIAALALGGNPEQVFIWLSSTASSGLFLIGSAYFVAGSYPHAQQFYYAAGRGQLEQDPATLSKSQSRNVSNSNLEAGEGNSSQMQSNQYHTTISESKNIKIIQPETINPLLQQQSSTDTTPSNVISSLAALKRNVSGANFDSTASTIDQSSDNLRRSQQNTLASEPPTPTPLLVDDEMDADDVDENRDDDDEEAEEEEDRRGLLTTQLNPLHTLSAVKPQPTSQERPPPTSKQPPRGPPPSTPPSSSTSAAGATVSLPQSQQTPSVQQASSQSRSKISANVTSSTLNTPAAAAAAAPLENKPSKRSTTANDRIESPNDQSTPK